MTESRTWQTKIAGPARRALEKELPENVAWAACTFITKRLPINPRRLGGALNDPYDGILSAHLGTYRVVYRIEEENHTVYVLAVRLRGDVYGIR
ncbi:type II toxin-antitoxin system RelE family toxin [Candidatus Protofrankia californiensis]|uniref:type II toxin-antitoxin system RelE family toxin n=1 Tax=Candidatus Protofrankia californiensis TaxID=1839754 RepID=UPI001041B952|nr:type II toxin-antitoxin system RelE/ParE family toxin [Candidatus Protofrankia californiensis]